MIEHNERPISAACQNCSKELLASLKGRRKRFCSDACRKALKRGISGQKSLSPYHPPGSEKSSNFLSENQCLAVSGNEELELSRSSAHSLKALTFQKLNSITCKLTDGVQINTGSGRASRALGYVMEVSSGRWMARVRNLGSDLLSFGAAKQEAIRLYECRGEGPLDWIRELNLRTAGEIDRSALANEKRKVPFDLMGGGKRWLNPVHVDRQVIRNVIEVETCIPFREEDMQQETLKGDDYPLTYDVDGFAKLPACLDRRKPRLRQAA